MPCCCESNVKASFVMGIIFIVFNILALVVARDIQAIVGGLIFAVVNGILVFGAHKRNKDALLVWIILAAIEALVYIIFCILVIVNLVLVGNVSNSYYQVKSAVDLAIAVSAIVLIIYLAITTLLIWTMVVASRARKEIMNPPAPVNKA